MINPLNQYSQDKAELVCECIMNGWSLRKIEAEHKIRRLAVLKWLREEPEFQTQYAYAREEQADYLAEEMLEIADNKQGDYRLDPDHGLVVDGDNIQRARLRVDSRKWYASKLKPKKYGEKISQELTGKDGASLNLTQIFVTDKEAASIVKALDDTY